MSVAPNSIEVTGQVASTTPTHDALLRTLHEQQQLIADLQAKLDDSTEDIGKNNDIIANNLDVIANQKRRIAQLEEYLRLARQRRFGASSEKNLLQGELFNEAELLSDGESDPSGESEAEEPEADEAVSRPRKKKRKGLSDKLPRIQQYHRLSEEEKAGAISTFFEHVKDELDIVPAKVQVIEHFQEKAVFVDDEGNRSLKAATRTPHPLGKSIASVSLLAWLIVAKYADCLPLYRLEGIVKRYGGEITRTAMANWLIRLSVQLQPVVNLLEDALLDCQYLMGDETRIQVLKEKGMEPTGNKYMWVMRGGPPDRPVLLFNYDKSRGKAVAERLLAGYEGTYFQSDGYAGYDEPCANKGIVHVGCWDHARRRFADVVKSMPKAKKGDKPSIAQMAMAKINALYRIEREADAAGLDEDERYEYRQHHSVPKLESLKQWLEKTAPRVDKDSNTYKAIAYTLNQWDKLVRYCDHGSLRMSNILAENAIRPFAVGRRNWLFADTPEGARASAIYYSLIETAKANNLDPYEYLHFLISRIATADTVDAYEALLPWNMK